MTGLDALMLLLAVALFATGWGFVELAAGAIERPGRGGRSA